MGHVQQSSGAAFKAGQKGASYDPTPAETKQGLERLTNARLRLKVYLPFMGDLSLRLKFMIASPEMAVPSACVTPDGYCIFNYKFLEALTRQEVAGVICHEMMHLALLHEQRLGGRNRILWNLACDYSFNLDILDMAARADAQGQVALPPGVLVEEKYRGKTAEMIYDILLTQAQQSQEQGKGQEIPFECPDGERGDMRPDLAQSEEGKRAAGGSQAHQKELANEWKAAVIQAAQRQAARKAGTIPAGISKLIEAWSAPRVAWPEVLSRWLGENGPRSDYSYRRPSRRSHVLDVILPSLQRHGCSDIVIFWDSSGSQWGREGEIIPEIGAISEDMGLSTRVLIGDVGIQADVEDVRTAQDLLAHYKGGGGSDFRPMFQRLADEGSTAVVIAFTDGFIAVPEFPPPSLRAVLWVLWDEHKDIDPTGGRWGTVLRVHTDGTATFGGK